MDNHKYQKVRIIISNRTVFRVLGILIVTYLSIKLFFKVHQIIELVLLSFFFSIALNPTVSTISRWLRLKSRIIATGIAYIIVIGTISTVLFFITPSLARETISYAKNIPSTISGLNNPNSGSEKFIKKYHLTSQVNNLEIYVKQHTVNLRIPVVSTATRIGGVLESIVIVFVLTFMMLIEGPQWISNYWKLSIGKKDWHSTLAKKMNRIIAGYINGQIVIALIGAVFTFLALSIVSTILNVHVNAAALSVIVFFTGLIPLFGHIVGLILILIACLIVSWPLALIVFVIMFIYLQVENATFQPYIQAKYNELTPLLVFISVLVGIEAGGIFGAFIAIPLAGCAKVAFKEYLLQRKWIKD
jgi:predicted PurR-regulated permease PerM